MAITFGLMEVSQYRIRYLASTSAAADPQAGIITNRPAGGTGLQTDTGGVFKNSPINKLVKQAVANQAAARRLFQGDGLVTRIALEVERGHVRVTPITTQATSSTFWAIDINEGAAGGDAQSAGFAVILVGATGQASQQAYVDLYFEHSFDR